MVFDLSAAAVRVLAPSVLPLMKLAGGPGERVPLLGPGEASPLLRATGAILLLMIADDIVRRDAALAYGMLVLITLGDKS
eukprot:SAG22_NODE_729_length_7596_cov_20.310924_7_plen_80_part_00